jgi:hypothetical protein
MVRLDRAYAAGTSATRRETRMSRPPRRAKQDWSHKLARPLAVDNGMKLTTLADARTAVLYVFGSVDARTCPGYSRA